MFLRKLCISWNQNQFTFRLLYIIFFIYISRLNTYNDVFYYLKHGNMIYNSYVCKIIIRCLGFNSLACNFPNFSCWSDSSITDFSNILVSPQITLQTVAVVERYFLFCVFFSLSFQFPYVKCKLTQVRSSDIRCCCLMGLCLWVVGTCTGFYDCN